MAPEDAAMEDAKQVGVLMRNRMHLARELGDVPVAAGEQISKAM